MLRILYLEDERQDAELVQEMLEAEGFTCDVSRVETQVEFCASLEREGLDLILADYTLPSFDGISALRLAVARRPELPFIFVSGTLGEEVAIEALNIGATDYVLKTRLTRLVPSVVRALREATERAERKQAEESLRRSEIYLAEAQRLSHTGSFGWNVASGQIFWSEETYNIFEVAREVQPALQLVLQRTYPDDRDLVQHTIGRASEERSAFDFEHRLLMPDGSVKSVRVVAHPWRSDEPGGLLFVGALTDITREKWAQAERERLEQRLRQAAKMEAVGRFASGIAHDFNNVLTAVFVCGGMLSKAVSTDSPLKRHAQKVLEAATRGRKLTEQILAFSRSQRGNREPVDLANVVAETLELLQGSLPDGIRLETSACASPLVVIGDAIQLHQVVMNLCSNAIQAMREGGILRVMLDIAERPAERAPTHGTLGTGDYLRLTIEDNGSGMDEATVAQIFEPFFTTKAVGQGTGLGLSLVYNIVTELGGAIDVKSTPSQGSKFTIYLPRSEPSLPPPGRGAAVTTSN